MRRARDDRRPGGLELADPQLPRLRSRRHRRRACPARLPAGVGVRRPVRDQPRGRRAPARATSPTESSAIRATSPPGARSCSPPASPTPGSASPGWRRSSGAGVYYGASTVEGLGLDTEDVYVIGGGNSAGQAALHLSRSAARVRLLVRGASLGRGHVAVPVRRRSRDPQRRGAVRRRRSSMAAATGASSGSSCVTTRPMSGGASDAAALYILIGCPPAYLLAAGGDRPGAQRPPPHRPP